MSSVGFVLPGYPRRPVGGYRVAYFYASYLAAQGHDVTIYHEHTFADASRRPAGAPSNWHRTAVGRARSLALASFAKMRPGDGGPPWFKLDEHVRVRNVVRLTPSSVVDCDVLVATAVSTAPFVAAEAQRRGIHGAYLIQSFEDWDAPREFVESTWRLPLTKVVIASWLQEKGHELGVDTVLVPNAIDPVDMPPGPPVEERHTDVLALVSAVPVKRTDLVIDAMNALYSRIEGFTGVTFGICGRPQGLPNSVTHHTNPPRGQLSSLYRDSKIYLCASDTEGWHLPPAEAMASGAAVVSTDIGGVRAYANDSTAVFTPVGSSADLVEAAISLIHDPARCQALAEAGQRAILGYGPDDAASAFARALLL